MKRTVSIILSLALIVGMVMSLPFSAGAITIEETDAELVAATGVTVFDFEEDGVIKVGSQSLSDKKVSWKVDAENTLEYYYSGWGFSRIANNPVKAATSAQGSIVNASDRALGAAKTQYNTWPTGGGFVINTETSLGTKPYMLESNTTYTVEFDYLINATHLYGEVKKPDGTTMTIPSDAEDVLSIGYGYKENTDTSYGAVKGYNTTVASVAKYKPSRDVDGTFTAYDGVKEVGNWYHFSVTFKTGAFESIYSTANAPFLILYASLYTGAEMYVDNFSVCKTATNSAFFNFEDKDYMHATSQSPDSKKCEWQVDAVNKIEYFIAGWGFASIKDNPVKESTGVSGSVTNPSTMALEARKTAYNGWGTSGGLVINRKTEKGVEPLILEDNTTYTVEFDYLVNGTHIYGDWVDPTDGTKSGTISTSATSLMSFGYGYRITNTSGLAPVNTPKTTVANIAKYVPSSNADGTFTDATGATKQVGNWYHQSHTFTTGTFDSIFSEYTTSSNLPFLIFYASMYTGDWFMVDNIRITKHVAINLNANGGTVSDASYKGVLGSKLSLPTPSKMGYEFTGWYKDGACTVPFTDVYFTKENMNSTIYAGWKMGIESFENYTGTGMNTSYFSVSGDQAYMGSKSIKYSWTRKTLDLTGSRNSKNNYFPIRALNNDGETSTTYKLTFKYYIGNVNMTVQPALVKNASNSTSITTLGSATTLSSAGTGRWQTMSIVFTVTNSSLATYPNLALYAYAASNTTTTAYFDDFEISPIKSGAATGSLTVYGGAGNAAGATSRSVALVNGDVIDNGFVYKDGYAVEGWYKDSGLTDKIPANVYTTGISSAYPKFGDRVDLTANGTRTRTGDFAQAGYNDSLTYSGASGSGTASLANAAAGTYMVEFLYKNNGGSDVTVTVGSNTFTLGRGKSDKWYKGYVPVTTTAAGVISLSASGKSAVEIKDVHIKNLSGMVYMLFDSTEFGGEVVAVYGAAGSSISFPANPIVSGKQFGGWFNGDTQFTATVFPSTSVSLVAKMTTAGEVVKGDSNGDGVCNSSDLAKMKLYLAKVDKVAAEGADINGDGKINAVDLVLLYNTLAVN